MYSFRRCRKPLPPAIPVGSSMQQERDVLLRSYAWVELGVIETPFDAPFHYRPCRQSFSLDGQVSLEGFGDG